MKQGVFMRALASDSTEATIDIIGVVGWEVGYQQLRDIIASIPETIQKVVFQIFSPGGDVWEGNGIIQEIGELNKRVQTEARVQVAASMATLIAVACQRRTIASNGRFLIHNAWSAVQGDAAEMEKMAQTLRDCEQEAAELYAKRTGGTVDEMLAIMEQERWMMPAEVLELGFVDEIIDPFAEEDFEAVKEEIVAAGKWPKALVDLPEPEEEEPDATTADEGAGEPETAATGEPEPTAVPEAAKSEEQIRAEVEMEYSEKLAALDEARGSADGEVERLQGEVATLTTSMADALAERDKLISKYQSEKDQAIAQAKADAEAKDKTIEELTATLGVANDRLAKLLRGSLTFDPTPVETWEEVMAACGGDYEKAAKQDQDGKLRAAYRAKQGNQKKRG